MDGALERRWAVTRDVIAIKQGGDGHLSRAARAMFLRVLVTHLREVGAASTSALPGQLKYMEIELPTDDVMRVVEYARRHDLIEPVGHPQQADGTAIRATEWRPTDSGLKLWPAPSESPANEDMVLRRMGDWFGRVVKPIGIATVLTAVVGTVLTAIAGTIKQPKDLAAWVVGVFGLLTIFAGLVSYLLTRHNDWLVLKGWPHYTRMLERCWDEYRELKSGRRWWAWLRWKHLRYWRFISKRAALINGAARRAAAESDAERAASETR
jgi:hypothetical protein